MMPGVSDDAPKQSWQSHRQYERRHAQSNNCHRFALSSRNLLWSNKTRASGAVGSRPRDIGSIAIPIPHKPLISLHPTTIATVDGLIPSLACAGGGLRHLADRLPDHLPVLAVAAPKAHLL
jgi:hypothetical protein